MKIYSTVLLFFYAGLQLFAQDINPKNLTSEQKNSEILPQFTGGNQALRSFIEQNNNWKVGQETIVGKVFVEFMVETDGSVSNIQVIKGLEERCDEEAKRIVSTFPKFKPGEKSGVPTRMKMVVPITFDGLKIELDCETQFINTSGFSGISLGPSCNYFQDLIGLFQPTLDQIILAEKVMEEQLYQRMIDHPLIDPNHAIKKPSKHYRKWKRQYYGFINEKGEQLIEINLLNFGARNAKEIFEGWNSNYFLGFGEFYEKNTRRYSFNLTTGKLVI